MGSEPVLIIDTSYLAWRAMYSTGGLSFDGVGTGVVYGVLKTVIDLMELFATKRVVWTFDGGHDGRTQLCPTYKVVCSSTKSTVDEATRREVRRQIYRLRTSYLKTIGFKNVLWQEGYEADDLIASTCDDLPKGQEAIIVSADHDLFQLLSPRVSIWSVTTKAMLTQEMFVNETGIDPFMWSDVKAIAGCTSDNVVGIRGVGDKTAAKFLAGKLKPTSKAFMSITTDQNGTWKRNLLLVRLPFPGTKKFVLDFEERLDFDPVFEKLGIKTLSRKARRVG